MPVYNDALSIESSLNSVLKQNYENIEIIVSDNGSTDSTYQILKNYKNIDKRIKLSQNENNLGWQGNSNKVLQLAEGEYVVTQHGDDQYIRPDYINHVVGIFEDNPSVGVIHFILLGDSISYFDNFGLIDKMNYLDKITTSTYMPAPTVTAFRNEALKQTNYYSGDYWNSEVRLSIDLVIAGYDAFIVPDNSYFKRDIGASKDSSISERRVERLAHLYALYGDLAMAEGIFFDRKEFEKNIVKEYLLLKTHNVFKEFEDYIEHVKNVIINEEIVTEYCLDLLKKIN